MTCEKAGAGDWQPVGLSVATVTTVRPCWPQQLTGREHKGFSGSTGWFGQLFFPKFQALHLCVAHVEGPGANFGPRGLCVMVGSGAQFRSGLATTYVRLPEKVKCG